MVSTYFASQPTKAPLPLVPASTAGQQQEQGPQQQAGTSGRAASGAAASSSPGRGQQKSLMAFFQRQPQQQIQQQPQLDGPVLPLQRHHPQQPPKPGIKSVAGGPSGCSIDGRLAGPPLHAPSDIANVGAAAAAHAAPAGKWGHFLPAEGGTPAQLGGGGELGAKALAQPQQEQQEGMGRGPAPIGILPSGTGFGGIAGQKRAYAAMCDQQQQRRH